MMSLTIEPPTIFRLVVFLYPFQEGGRLETNEKRFILCPVCRRSTKVKANPDTELKRFPLYCPWCKEEYIVDKAKAE
jgi:hypothetical protein